MWDLFVSVPDHCLSFYFPTGSRKHGKWIKKIPYMEKSWNLKTRAVRGSDYSPAILLSEEKDKFIN